jgi:hypothetical protein
MQGPYRMSNHQDENEILAKENEELRQKLSSLSQFFLCVRIAALLLITGISAQVCCLISPTSTEEYHRRVRACGSVDVADRCIRSTIQTSRLNGGRAAACSCISEKTELRLDWIVQ